MRRRRARSAATTESRSCRGRRWSAPVLVPAPPENIVRWLDIDLPEHGFGCGALHILCLVPKLKDGVPGQAKTRFWNAVFGAAAARLHEPFLLVGDLNTGAHRVDETGKTFVCAEHFGKLSAPGWTDMWRHHNPGATEWTWYSKLNGGARGNGFRLDHAFATRRRAWLRASRRAGIRMWSARREPAITRCALWEWSDGAHPQSLNCLRSS